MVYTLTQYASMEKEPLAKGMMLGIAQEGVIADIFPWRSIGSLSETGTRFDDVPDIAFVELNGTIAETTVDGHQINHAVYQLLSHIDIPRPLEEATSTVLQRPSQTQLMLAKKGAAYKINDQFINGDQGTDPNGFNGLKKIVGALASAQTVGATQLDISGASNHEAAVDRIHATMDAIDGHMPTAGFANSQFLLRFESMARQMDLVGVDYNWKNAALEVNDPRSTQTTASQKPAFMYRHVPFYNLGVKADQSTQVILNTYSDAALGSADNTRVFFTKVGEDNLEGIQFKPLSVDDIGLLEAKDNYRWRLRWILGLAPWGPRCAAMAQGLKVT